MTIILTIFNDKNQVFSSSSALQAIKSLNLLVTIQTFPSLIHNNPFFYLRESVCNVIREVVASCQPVNKLRSYNTTPPPSSKTRTCQIILTRPRRKIINILKNDILIRKREITFLAG